MGLKPGSDGLDYLHGLTQRIENPKSREIVRLYLRDRRAGHVKPGTLADNAHALVDLAEALGTKPLDKATRDDLMEWASKSEKFRLFRNDPTPRKVRLLPSTLAKRNQNVRQFYKWFYKTRDYPELVRDLGTKQPTRDQIPTSDLLSSDDILQLIKANVGPRDKALLSVMYETGMRAGEICALNVGSVEFDQYGALLTLPKTGLGLKTGARRVRLIKGRSELYLKEWLNVHPFQGDRSAPLYVGFSRRAPNARLTPNALWAFCQRAAKAAKFDKELHPHLFRHTAATERARDGWREAEMRAFFGWTRSSEMPAVYVHLAGQDYEDMLLKREGLKQEDAKEKSAFRPLKCRSCANDNAPTSLFCARCGAPITAKGEADVARVQDESMRQVIRTEVQRLILAELQARRP